MDAKGQVRWIVDHIADHEDPPRAATSSAHVKRAVPSARKYRIRWLGFPPEQDTWEPRSSLLRKVPDVVRDYESMACGHPDVSIVVNVLAVSENGKATYDVENESDVVTRGVASESENENEDES